MDRVSPEPTSGCWLWTGGVNTSGYGQMSVGVTTARGNPKLGLVHRISYEEHVGPIPEGLVLMHACDTRCCVNPAHLRPGTVAENNLDMVAKGRHRNGRRAA